VSVQSLLFRKPKSGPAHDFKLLDGDHLTIICEEKTLGKLGRIFG